MTDIELPDHPDARVRLLLHAALAGDDIPGAFVDAVLDEALPLQRGSSNPQVRAAFDATVSELGNALLRADSDSAGADFYLDLAHANAVALVTREAEIALQIAAPAIAESPVGSGDASEAPTPPDYHHHREEAAALLGYGERGDFASQQEADAYRRDNIAEARIHALLDIADAIRGTS